MSDADTASTWQDPDDAPPLDKDWFDRAEIRKGDQIIRPGRPRSPSPKEAVSLRLDQDVVTWFRNSGPGWQTRINEELRKVAGV